MQKLFQPYTLNNGIEIKNRLAVAPMTHWASDREGKLTAEERAFLDRRATGFGLFITAATLVSIEGKAFDGEPHAIDEGDIANLRETAEIIRKQGAKAILQIHHGGKLAVAELIEGKDKVAPSADAESGSCELTAAEIENLVQAYANAADLAVQASFDGVEIHGANGYLIQQFYSGHSNRRTDEWGGSVEKRLKFPLAVLDAVLVVREKHRRPDFIIGYRFSPEEPEELGITMSETFVLIDELIKRPLQYLHASLHDFFVNARRGADTGRMRIEQIHARIHGKVPLIGVGNLLTAEQMKRAFETDFAEFIALGKSVLLNPNLVELLEQGKFDQIETELDPDRKAFYQFPEKLWAINMSAPEFLPKLKQSN